MPHVLAQDLRNAVLQAAIQGKLVANYRNEKAVCVKECAISNLDDIGFENWKFAYLEDINKVIDCPHSTPSYTESFKGYLCLRTRELKQGQIEWDRLLFLDEETYTQRIARYKPVKGDIVYAREGNYGVCAIIDRDTPLALGQRLVVLSTNETIALSKYIYYVLISDYCLKQALEKQKGMTAIHVNVKDIKKFVIPLPPIEEQARIVARVEELMAKIDEYEKIEKELTELQKAFPGNMKDAILQAAFSGALSKQNENDHSAFAVLKELGISEPDDNPYDLPNNWAWTRFEDVSTYTKSKKKINAKDAEPATWMLDMEDIERGGKLLVRKTVAERKAIGDKTIFTKGNILYAKLRPYLQKIIIAEDDGICTPELVPFDMLGGINSKYALYYLKSPYVDSEVNKASYGVKMPRVGTETMKELRFPVCPAEEQAEIVHRLDTIIPLCDQLQEVA